MNTTDKLIGELFPKWAASRAYHRAKLKYAEVITERVQSEQQRASFKSAEFTRLNSNFPLWTGDLNDILQSKLRVMRGRSRWLCANNPHASSAIGILINYVIGTGMMPLSAVRSMVREMVDGVEVLHAVEKDAWNDYTDDLFEVWAENVDLSCTSYNPGTFRDLQAMAMRRWFEDGEVIIRTHAVKSWPIVPFAVEMLMPEWLNESMRRCKETGNEVRLGVEVDKYSRPVAYHFYKADGEGKIEFTEDSVRVPASDIIHIFVRHQPRQLRGIPPMNSVLERFFQLDEYTDYELIAAKIAACFGAFITTPPGDPGGVIQTEGKSTNVTDSQGNILTTVEPGIIGKLPPGYGVEFAQPQKPGSTFGPFTEYQQRTIGAGIEFGLSYESLTRDTSKSSFAGGRLSQLMDFQTFRTLQGMFGDKLVKQVRHRWLDVGVKSGAVIAPGYHTSPGPEYWRRIEILTSGWPWGINPLQEVNASRASMRAGVTTLADETSYLGRTWKQQVRLKAKIDRECARLGVTLDSDAANDAKSAQTQPVPDEVDPSKKEIEDASV